MNPIDILIRALASALTGVRDFGAEVSEQEAGERFLKAVSANRCPRCNGTSCRASGPRQGFCPTCRRKHSLTAQTAIANTKVKIRLWLAAIWHLHVDDRTISARGFQRRYGVDKMTAWRLLHQVRRALPYVALPSPAGAVSQVLGKEAARNTARVCMAIGENTLVAVDMRDAGVLRGAGSPANALFLGRLRAWLTANFHGVSKRYLWLYLAEFADRYCRLKPGRAQVA